MKNNYILVHDLTSKKGIALSFLGASAAQPFRVIALLCIDQAASRITAKQELFATVFHGSVPFGMSPYGRLDACQCYVCFVAIYCMLCVICPLGC
jgi:hypothetical protein